MNPAALKSDLGRLEPGGTLIVNVDAFEPRNLEKAGYDVNPLEDDSLAGYTVYEVPMTSLTRAACEPLGVKPRDAERSKNFFALGLISWMYTRPSEPTLDWIREKFAGKDQVIAANEASFKAGHAFGETAELFDHQYQVRPSHQAPGTYTNINGNTALAWGLIAASQQAQMPLFLGSYPITPASDILHELARHKEFGIRTLQAEDEIAGIGSALGAAFGGHLAITTTSGPGVALKSETISLAISMELPLVIVDIQRGGPSTGLPTKTEAADLMMALYGRHGEAPLPVVAASTPADCFFAAIEACRIALAYRTPVILLSDGYLANGSEPWCLPDVADLPDLMPTFTTEANATDPDGAPRYLPYKRDPETLARDWVIPGTPGLMHRIGGLEKGDETGNVSYDPANHERMVHLRAEKVAAVAKSYPALEVDGDVEDAEVLLVGWGSTWGAINGAADRVRGRDHKVATVHLRNLSPLPSDLGEILRRYPKVLVPEMNLGQLSKVLRAEYLVDAQSVSKVAGLPFTAGELERAILEALDG
jgi:2-oxoglutarate ferredoxin oxidoreductase subunit alpha